MRLGTRGSALALAQAEQVAKLLEARTGEAVELIPIDPFDGPALQLARAAADSGQFPFKTVKEYEKEIKQYNDVHIL